jgi:glycosyltransferase involved in cell wall biosynthesis
MDMGLGRFIIIIPFHNAHDVLGECLDSVIAQKYKNWVAVCADDHSDDSSLDLVPSESRFIKLRTEKRITALANIYHAILNSGIEYQDEDVVCILDGDDKFLQPEALEVVAGYYRSRPNCLVTYGQYVASNGNPGHCKRYTRDEFDDLRNKSFRASHLLTFKWKLYKEFLRQDPEVNSYKDENGEFFTMTYDQALIFPLMEIAGYPNVVFNDKPIYWYRLHEKNDHMIDRARQIEIEAKIRSKPKFPPVFLPWYYRIYIRTYERARRIYRFIKSFSPAKRACQ